MGRITIDYPDSIVARVAAAYEVLPAQLKQAILNDIKAKVVTYEKRQAEKNELVTLQTAEETYRASIAAANLKAENEITLS